ncbi:MAG: D-hexose-6-phosphate mutarotase [Bacteroidota bacterium]|nr:D-hexose-6-phosphate mutarotase [Bacteroidota bacterium]
MTINELNEKFAISGVSFFSGKGELPMVKIDNQYAHVVISLYGAHVISYQPKGQQDVFWMSEVSDFEAGKPIRGGIPVCFPWFGPHATDSTKPQHGFGRLLTWNVKEVISLASGETQIRLGLQSSDASKKYWSFDFSAEFTVIVGSKIDVTLSYTNTGSETFVVSDALHTYFNVSDIAKIGITGLTGTKFYDYTEKEVPLKTDSLSSLPIAKEENRRYIDTAADCIITDEGFGRKIRMAKRGSNTTVVWNPWTNAKNIADIPDEGYKNYVCVEATNACNDLITLGPKQSFCISTIISVE